MIHLKTVFNSMSMLSRIIIVIGYLMVVSVIAVSMFILLFAERFFADFTTAFYWYEQCILLGREMLGATVVPVMLFELFVKFISLKR